MQNELRRYLLGQLEEAEQEKLELRLLEDPSFGEEFDMAVDEILDLYVRNELGGEERNRVEQYFLTSAERRQKLHFASELAERAATERGGRRAKAGTSAPGLIERILAFWRRQSFSFRTAAAMATIVIVVGLGYLASSRVTGPGTLASMSLTINTSDRASGTEVKSVKLEPRTGVLRIELALPDQSQAAQNYRVELIDEQQRARTVPIKERTDKLLVIEIPANEITRGRNIIHLYRNELRVRGSYFFDVQ